MTVTSEVRAAYLELVDRRFGIRASDYGGTRIDDAINHVLETSHCAQAEELLDLLESGEQPALLELLVEHLTVGETYFLRDPAQIGALRSTILPEILRRRDGERRVRMWSAGCSTGEEPYTLAILLKEQTVLDDWQVLLVGTDVNRESLRLAREACYPAWSFRATSEQFRQRYFKPANDGARWKLSEAVRRMVRFAWSNLGADPLEPPSNDFDLIVCRNVTIYFDDAATQRLYRVLVASLAPGGWLMLGPSDPMPADRDLLERVDAPDTVLWRRRSAVAAVPRVHAQPRPVESQPRLPRPEPAKVPRLVVVGDGQAELEAGLLALEAGSACSALEWLRRATFRDPHDAVAQFALARAYLGMGDTGRAQAALFHTERLLRDLSSDVVPNSDDVNVETLRQAVRTHLSALEGAQA